MQHENSHFWTKVILVGTVAALVVAPASTARAVVSAASDVPSAQLAAVAPAPPGVLPTMATTNPTNVTCVATTDQFTPPTYADAEKAAASACQKSLDPSRPVPVIQTPGSFFAGYAFGKSSQFVYGPQVGIGAAILFPLHQPSLTLTATTVNPATPVIAAQTFSFALPTSMTWSTDLAVSLDANFASFTFPNSGTASASGSGAQQTFNVGIFLAPQFGWQWWDSSGSVKSVMFSLGVLAGYINTTATGPAFALGVQPGLAAQF
jgi:hypothetical protein